MFRYLNQCPKITVVLSIANVHWYTRIDGNCKILITKYFLVKLFSCCFCVSCSRFRIYQEQWKGLRKIESESNFLIICRHLNLVKHHRIISLLKVRKLKHWLQLSKALIYIEAKVLRPNTKNNNLIVQVSV